MFAIYRKYREFREALDAGEWRKAARIVIDLLDLLVPEDDDAIREPVGGDGEEELTEEDFKEDQKAVKKALAKPPKGAKAVGAGGAIAVALITTLGPVLVDLIKKRIKEREQQATENTEGQTEE